MRFTIRDLLWLITGLAIAFAILGTLWRREHATWSQELMMLRQERAALQGDVDSQKARAIAAERNLKGLRQDLEDPAVIEELILAAKVQQQFRNQRERQQSPSPIPRPRSPN